MSEDRYQECRQKAVEMFESMEPEEQQEWLNTVATARKDMHEEEYPDTELVIPPEVLKADAIAILTQIMLQVNAQYEEVATPEMVNQLRREELKRLREEHPEWRVKELSTALTEAVGERVRGAIAARAF